MKCSAAGACSTTCSAPGNDSAFEFLQDVLTGGDGALPSQYIHIGGDECPKERWKTCAKCQARMKAEGLKDEHELQSYFIQRIEKFVNARAATSSAGTRS